MGEAHKLTEAGARILDVLSQAPGGQGFRDEFSRKELMALRDAGFVRAPRGDFGRVYLDDAGRAALARHRGETHADQR